MALLVRATGGQAAALDEAMLRRALAVLADPARGIELRGLPSGRSRTLPGSATGGLMNIARELANDKGVYYSLGAVPPDLDRPCKAPDVLVRRWLLIDCDPKREKDTNATEEEHEAARRTAVEVMEDLCEAGWPSPLLIDSGNGWHLVYRIDLEATAHSQALVRRLLHNLARVYDTSSVTIDTSVSNANRHGKLPGTQARKGPHSPERPHRPVRMVHCPESPEVVPAELLAELAGPEPAPRPQRTGGLRLRVGARGREAYGRAALDRELARLRLATSHRNNALNAAAFSLFQLVAGGVLVGEVVERELLAAALGVGLSEREALGTIASAREAGLREPRGLPDQGAAAPAANGKHEAPGGLESVILRGSDVKPRKVEWLWPNRIPLGKMTTFAGIGGLGKTFVLCDIAARVSRGLPWPDAPEGPNAAGRVLFISGEDDPDDTLVPRMIELGADLDRVAFLRQEALDGFTLGNLALLDKAVAQLSDARLVVIDPPTAFLAGVDDHKNAELRSLLSPLKSWAARHRVALIFNTHVNKGSGQKVEAMMRVMGSVAWVNAVRSAHMFARDPEEPTRRLFVGMKNNLGKERKGLAYRLVASGDDMARVEWLGEVDTTADQAVNRESSRPKKIVASEWLVEMFGRQRAWPSNELFDAAKQAGLSRDAVFQAKDRLKLPKARQECLENGDKRWVWWVPDDWEHLPSKLAPGEGEVTGPVSGTVEDVRQCDTDTVCET